LLFGIPRISLYLKDVNLTRFYELETPEQCRVLYLEGEFLMAIRYYEYKVNLYSLGSDLVEVFYNHKLDRIHKIQSLDRRSNRMNFYADQVNLNSILTTQEGR
jgi:hypothetical protein